MPATATVRWMCLRIVGDPREQSGDRCERLKPMLRQPSEGRRGARGRARPGRQLSWWLARGRMVLARSRASFFSIPLNVLRGLLCRMRSIFHSGGARAPVVKGRELKDRYKRHVLARELL